LSRHPNQFRSSSFRVEVRPCWLGALVCDQPPGLVLDDVSYFLFLVGAANALILLRLLILAVFILIPAAIFLILAVSSLIPTVLVYVLVLLFIRVFFVIHYFIIAPNA